MMILAHAARIICLNNQNIVTYAAELTSSAKEETTSQEPQPEDI